MNIFWKWTLLWWAYRDLKAIQLKEVRKEQKEENRVNKMRGSVAKSITEAIVNTGAILDKDISQKVIWILLEILDIKNTDKKPDSLLIKSIDYNFPIHDGSGVVDHKYHDILNLCEDIFWINIPERDREYGDFKPILNTVWELIQYITKKVSKKHK